MGIKLKLLERIPLLTPGGHQVSELFDILHKGIKVRDMWRQENI
jgi:hypothetical protein